MQIRRYEPRDREAVVRLSLAAWEPVFVSLEQILDTAVYREFYPDWRQVQQESVQQTCGDDKYTVWVAHDGDTVLGFVAAHRHDAQMGEIYMIAVDPAHQRRGVSAALTSTALDWLKSQGVSIAMVETGGDPGHAPARQAYERAGFRLFPVARYFKKL